MNQSKVENRTAELRYATCPDCGHTYCLDTEWHKCDEPRPVSDNTAGETMTIAQAINARVAVGCCPCDRCAQALDVIEAHMSALDALREAVKPVRADVEQQWAQWGPACCPEVGAAEMRVLLVSIVRLLGESGNG